MTFAEFNGIAEIVGFFLLRLLACACLGAGFGAAAMTLWLVAKDEREVGGHNVQIATLLIIAGGVLLIAEGVLR